MKKVVFFFLLCFAFTSSAQQYKIAEGFKVAFTNPDVSGNFAITVDGRDLQSDTDHRLTASVTGTGGTLATALQNYAVDVDAPVQTITLIGISTDSGLLGDFMTSERAKYEKVVKASGARVD